MKFFATKLLLVLSIILIGTQSSFGAAKTWVGPAGGGSWSTASNWSPAAIPGTTDDIIINAGTSAMSFTGMSSQTIASLTINGTTGSVTFTSGASTLTVTGNFTSAIDVTTGVISITAGGSGSAIAAGKTLTISSASQLSITSGGVFTVNGTITTTSAGTAPIATGSITRLIVPSGGVINYNCGGSLTTMPLMTVNAGGTLNIVTTNTIILSAMSIAGKLSIASTGSTPISSGGSSPTYATGSTLEYLNCIAIPENSVAWPTGSSGPTNVIVNSPNGVTITSTLGRQIKGTLTLTSGALILSGGSNTLTFNGTGSVQPIARTSGTLTTTSAPSISFSPTSPANWVIPAGTYTAAPTFTNFTAAMGSGGSLTMNEQFVTVSGTFTLTSGLVTLGTGDLQVATMSFFTPTATRMITTSSTSGYLKHSFSTSSFQSFLYPIGDLSVTAEYSGFTFTLNSNSTTRVIGFKVVDATHPNINTPTTATNFLSRYWPSTISPSSGTYDYDMQLPYNGTTGDINGTEANIGVAAWNGSSAWNAYDGAINTSSNYLDISGGTQATSPLGFDITGRQREDDECAGAINLGTVATSGCTNGVFNTQGATQSSTGCAGTADDDVWFKFTLPVGYTSVNFSTTTQSGSTDLVYQFYTGTCGSLTNKLCSDPETGQVTGLVGGTTYYFRAYTYFSGATTSSTICLSLPPANDECAGAIPFGTLVTGACANSQNVNTAFASQSSTGCAGTADDDVWYSFVLPAGYTAVNFSTVNISGSTDRVFQFYSGSCGSLTSVLCSDPESGQVSGLTPGVTYYIRTYTYFSGTSSNFTLCLTLPPVNDNCAGAISMGTLTTGGCNNATFNTLNASQSSSGCTGTADDDVWYSFTMPAGYSSLSFSTTNISGSTDLVYQFYSGSCGSLTSLLCSDPETGQLTNLTPGATYYFRVYTYFSGSVTNGTICITLPPANDECAGAITLPVNSSCIATAGTTVGATNSGTTSYCGSNTDDVWYSFTAPVSTSVAIQLTGTAGFDAALNLRGPATCPAYGTNLICYDYAGNNGTETLKITDLVAGSVYKIRVSKGFLNSGTFNICAASTYTPSGNDNVANALTANIGSTVGNTNSTYGIQLGEPAGSDWYFSGGVDDPTNSQWFKFTPTTTGCYSIASTGFDTELAIYSASNLSNFNTFNELASDEDSGPNGGYATYTSYIAGVQLTAFTTYYIQVSGYPYVSGTPTLIISNPLVAAIPVAQAATTPTCTGFTANWLTATDAASYQIDVATDAGFSNIVLSTSAGTGNSYVVSGLSGNTTYYYRIRGVNACGVAGSNSGTITVITLTSVGTPSFTSGATTLCAGGTSTYTATATNTSGITYSILSGGATIDANTGVVSNVTSDFTVRASAAGCNGPTTVDVFVTVISTIGTPVFTAGSATLCAGGTDTYTATAIGANTIAYSIVSGGAVINSTTGVVSSVTSDFVVRATATGSCGTPTTTDFSVTVSPAVGTTSFTAGSSTLCVGGTDTYTATATNSTSITYSILSGGAVIDANTGVVSSVTGNFTVRATATGTCGTPTTADFVVTVTPAVGTPSFTAGATSLCVGGTSTYTATATNSTSITYSILTGGATIDANTGVVSNVTADFVVQATAAGTCGNPTTATVSVTITGSVGTPSFTAGAATLCVGGTSTYTATAAGASAITYSILTGGATINASTGVVSNVTGDFTVRATATGACGGPTTADFVVTVTPNVVTPAFTAGATSLCVGATSTYTATALNSTNITYSILTGGATIDANTGLVSNVTGNFTVLATATGTCGTPTTATLAVTVTPNVGTPTFTGGATTLCVGGTSTYTATATNSTSINYSILSGGATIDANTGVVSNVTTDFVVQATATGTCGNPTTATIAVAIVNSVGTPTFIAGASTLCIGGTSTYTATATGSSNITYSILTGGATINGSTGVVSNVTGNFTVRATATGTCGNPTTADFVVTVTPNVGTPSFTAGASTLCIGGTSTYTATATNSSTITYSILAGGATINANTGVVSNVTGNFTVVATATGTCGTPTTTNFVVTVTPNVGTPTFTAGATTLCAGGTSTYTATASNSTNIVYSILSGGATINPSTGVVSNVTADFVVQATATGTCGNPTTATVAVTIVNSVGTPAFTAGASTLCIGATSTYTATATGASTITYSILSGGATINANTGVVSNVTGNFTVRATATGACGGPTTADFVVTITPNVGTPTFTAGAATLCVGATSTYAATATNSSTITYSILAGGATINANTGVVSNVTGNFTVVATATGACGTPTTTNLAVTVTPNVGTPTFTAGAATLCVGGTSTYTATAAGASSITYSIVSGGATINSSTGVVSNVTADFVVRATATGACGGPTITDFTVTITPSVQTPVFTTGALTLCAGSTDTYTATALNSTGITYSIVSGGATVNANTGAVSNVTGNFVIRATATGACGGPTTADQTITVNPVTTIITQPLTQAVCDGGSVTFSVVTNGQISGYQWYYNNGLINGANSSSFTINPVDVADAGNYTVALTGACGNATSQVAVLTVNASLSITQQPQTQSVCENDTITLSVGTNVNAQYQWQLGGNDINNATSANYTINGVALANAGNYSVNITSNCGNTTSSTAVLTVVPNITNTKTRNICNGSVFEFAGQFLTEPGIYIGIYPASNGCDSIVTLNLTVSGPTATIFLANGVDLSTGTFISYQWLFNGSPINNAINQTHTATANGDYQVIVTDAAGCSDTSDIITVTAVSVHETAQNYTLGVSPNPATTMVYLKGENLPAGKLSYTLYDVTGRVLDEHTIASVNGTVSQQVNMETFVPGIYLLTINNTQGHLQTFRIVRAE